MVTCPQATPITAEASLCVYLTSIWLRGSFHALETISYTGTFDLVKSESRDTGFAVLYALGSWAHLSVLFRGELELSALPVNNMSGLLHTRQKFANRLYLVTLLQSLFSSK